MNINFRGATVWARKTIESDIFFWKPAEWFKIWFYIITKVNHKDTKPFKRGTNYFNWSNESIQLKKITGNSWHECIKWLKSQKMITTQKTTRGIIITVCNYALYQDFNTYKNIDKSDDKSEASPKQVRSKSDTINNNDKNDNNDNKRERDKRENSPSYLKNIPEEDLIRFSNTYACNKYQIKTKAESLLLWLEKKGRAYKNYRAGLQDCLLKDFGKRSIKKEIIIPKGVEVIERG